MLHIFLEGGQVIDDLSGLKDVSNQKSYYYLDMLKFCYQVCFLLYSFFSVEGLQVFEQMLRFKM